MNKPIELNKMEVKFKIGEEHLGLTEELSLSGDDSMPSSKRSICMRQSRVPNRYAQVILTRTGKKPMTIAKDGRKLVIPVIAGNIVAQAKISSDGQLMTICCTTVGAVSDQCLLLDSGTDDTVADTIIKYAAEIQQACYSVICGKDYAYSTKKK